METEQTQPQIEDTTGRLDLADAAEVKRNLSTPSPWIAEDVSAQAAAEVTGSEDPTHIEEPRESSEEDPAQRERVQELLSRRSPWIQ